MLKRIDVKFAGSNLDSEASLLSNPHLKQALKSKQGVYEREGERRVMGHGRFGSR
jgi:hypothetical protein